MTSNEYQVSPRDDLTDNALVEESRRQAARCSVLWLTNYAWDQCPDYRMVRICERYEYGGRWYTA